MRFPDLEALIIARLPQLLPLPLDWCSTDTPEVLKGRVGVRIIAGPGSDDGLTDSTLVDVECFAPSRAGAFDLAEDVRIAMVAIAATDTSTAGDQLVDRVETAVRPAWSDYRDPDTNRVAASYRVFTRIQ